MARTFSSGNYLICSSSPVSQWPFTIAAWTRRTATPGASGNTFMRLRKSSNTIQWSQILFRNATDYPIAIGVGDGASNYYTQSATSATSTNTWHHGCAVFASNNSRTIYADGGNSATATTNVTTMTGLDQILIGVSQVGQVAHAGLWSVALTAAEVAMLYNGGIGVDPRSVRPDALVGYWPLIAGDDDRDWWGQYNMSVTGSLTDFRHPPVLMRSTPRFVIGGGGATTVDSVTITGTRTIGETVTAAVTTSPSDATKAYRWQKSVDDQGTGAGVITGETSSTLALTYEDFAAELDNGDNNIAYVRVGVIATSGGVDSPEEFSPWYEVGVPGSGGRRSPFVSQCI
jgi:hypothetical protein